MNKKQYKLLSLILRIGIFGVFFGHGMIAIAGNNSWIHFLTTAGFSKDQAVFLLPIIGYLDVFISLMVLFLPIKIVLIWAFIWAFSTALIRPLSGLSIWTFIERSANWVLPLALIVLQGFPKKWTDLFEV